MPQTFHVLLCVKCTTFQVHIVKKSSNKWNCKICDTKQSVQQVYAKGTGAECRDIVQRLNEARGIREHSLASKTIESIIIEQEQEAGFSNNQQFDGGFIERNNESELQQESQQVLCVPPENSKWAFFLDSN